MIGNKECEFVKPLSINVCLAQSADGDMVAIKKCGLPGPDGIPTYDDPLNEIRIHPRLNHPNITKYVGSGEDKETGRFIATQYLTGETAARRYFLKPEGQDDVLPLLTQLADAAKYLHSMNVIHRDITPENIIVSDEQAFLIDFGFATDFFPDNPPGFDDMTVKWGGMLECRSIWLRPPERKMGPWSDVFSLGVTGIYMLTGKPMLQTYYSAVSDSEREHDAERSLKGILRYLSGINPTVNDDLQTVLSKAASPKPESRHQNGREMLEALKTVNK